MTLPHKDLGHALEGKDLPALSQDFRAVFEVEFGFVCRSLRRLGVKTGDVEDVAQELFVAVHRAWLEYDQSRPIKAWLFSFALRYAANYRRLARHRVSVEHDVEAEPTVDSPNRATEERDFLLHALDQLDFDFRVAVVMHDIAGFSAPEIADSVGVPLNTIYSRIRLGRADLKATLIRMGKGGDS